MLKNDVRVAWLTRAAVATEVEVPKRLEENRVRLELRREPFSVKRDMLFGGVRRVQRASKGAAPTRTASYTLDVSGIGAVIEDLNAAGTPRSHSTPARMNALGCNACHQFHDTAPSKLPFSPSFRVRGRWRDRPSPEVSEQAFGYWSMRSQAGSRPTCYRAVRDAR